jgi:integrase
MAEAATAARDASGTPKRTEITDAVVPGLRLVIQPSGHKSWAFRYRFRGKPAKLTLGVAWFPSGGEPEPEATLGGRLSLEGARRLAREALGRLERGEDPATLKAPASAEKAPGDAFEVVARQFLARDQVPKNRTWKQTALFLGFKRRDNALPWALDNLAVKPGLSPLGEWSGRSLASITRRDIATLLNRVADECAATAPNAVLAAVRRLFSWSLQQGLIDVNPAAGMAKPRPVASRDRTLSDAELCEVLSALDAMERTAIDHRSPFVAAVRLLILTGQRRDEVARMQWSEVDLEGAMWRIPAERMKKAKPHEVPLSEAALKVLREVPRFEGCPFVLTTNGTTAISGWSKFKERLDQRVNAARAKEGRPKMADWRLHDLRRTLASGMAALGVALPVIERILAHTSGSFGGIVGVYQRHHFLPEMREALGRWAAHVEGLAQRGSGAG